MAATRHAARVATFVVFLRAANVGGSNTFRPTAVANAIDAFELTSLGAAGTFVARGATSAGAVRSAVSAALPFETDVLVHPAGELVALAEGEPFAALEGDLRGYVSVLVRAPDRPPSLPLDQPAGDAWQVRLVACEGPYVLSVRRTTVPGRSYPNEVVEKAFDVAATTRGWSTIERLVGKVAGAS